MFLGELEVINKRRVAIFLSVLIICVSAYVIIKAVSKSTSQYFQVRKFSLHAGRADGFKFKFKKMVSGVFLDDFIFTQSIKGDREKKLVIEAKKLRPQSKRVGLFSINAVKVMELSGVTVTLYENNLPVSSISSKKAVLNFNNDDKENFAAALTGGMDFSGDITIVTNDRRVLQCDKLKMDKNFIRFLARGNCSLSRDGEIIQADRIDSDIKLRNFSFSNYKNMVTKGLVGILT